MLRGIAASGGIGIGMVAVIARMPPVVARLDGTDPEREKGRFEKTTTQFTAEIEAACEKIARITGKEEADILRTQIALIGDPELKDELYGFLDVECVNLEYAFSAVCDRFIGLFSAIEDDLFRSRAADIKDVKTRALSIMTGQRCADLSGIPPGSVIAANDLSPSCMAEVDLHGIKGIVTEQGDYFSHLSIIARAMGLPMIVNAQGFLDTVHGGDTLILNGDTGEIFVNPDPGLLKRYREWQLMVR